ncbi:hypothetical protein [Ralstonia pseudosolanacearum]
MAAYPSVNWWPGNFRPYESRLSFLARFCDLNGINTRRCLKFLEINPDENAPVSSEAIARCSSVLHETLPAVQAMFSPSLRFVDCDHYAPFPSWHHHYWLRYCEACARDGYQSYLHGVGWLTMCPFHMEELKRAWGPHRTGTGAAGAIAALSVVMREHCKSWPHCSDCAPVFRQGQLADLEQWVVRASLAAAQMSHGELWRSDEDAFHGPLSVAQSIGQLRALAPMPEAIEPLFTNIGDTWHVETHSFPPQARAELERLKRLHLGFARIFDFYKCISAFSETPPSFVVLVRTVQDSLRARHGACHCGWGLANGGWESHWIKVPAEEGTRWLMPCPFDVGLTELEFGWGRHGPALKGRNAVGEQVCFVSWAHEIHVAGLIRYTKGAKVSPEGCLYIDQDITSCCEWIQGSPLTDLFNMAASWEVESAYSALSAWLDDIEDGLPPTQRDDPIYCVRLCATDDGLSLIRWIR